jgi:hypothetical protein
MPPLSTPSPADLTPDQRFHHVVSIVAQGVLRRRHGGRASAGEILSQFPPDRLGIVSEKRLSCSWALVPNQRPRMRA